MKIITSISKVLTLAIGLYFTANKTVAQTSQLTAPSNCIASAESVVVQQPNGTSITVVGKGNLNNHWTETIDGFTVKQNTNGNFEYAVSQNGKLTPGGTLATDPIVRNSTERNYVSSLQPSLKPVMNPLKASILSQVNAHLQNKTFPTSGNIRVLALLIDYPDLQNVLPKADFDSLLYGANYRSGDGSFKTFYETSSGNQLTVTVDVQGWYRATNLFQYYAADSGYDRAADLVREAVDAAEVAGTNFALYDNNTDGDVDGVLAVHAGPGAEIGGLSGLYIWSHRWVLNGGNMGSVIYDGVRINDYMINPETRSASNNSISGIGVFCHEFGHNLGLPDLYDTDNSNGDSEGIGNWCLMAGGAFSGSSNRPSNFSAWCREELAWDTPQTLLIGDNGTYSLPAASTSRDEIYRINSPLSNEYFLLENRQLVGRDSDLPGSGLAVWHINTNQTNAPGNSVNADETMKGVDLEEADGNDDLDNEVNRGDGGDLFPGTSNRTTFDDNTTPNAQTYLLTNTSMQIRNIVENAGIITFDFGRVPGPPCAASTTFNTNTGSFDDGSGAGFEYVNNQTCSWLITPTAGTVTLSFSTFDMEAINDTVTVYDGTTTGAPLLGRFSGSTIPASLTSSSNAMFVQFKSNATINGPGFDASYITNVPATPCSGTTTLTTATGNFSDGSGTANYTNNQNCSWLIQPTGAASITFGLTNLATEISNDRITVYDGATNASPILGSFSGTNNLNTLTSSGGSIFVEFSTNATITDQGFDAFYTSSTSTTGCSGATTFTATSGSFSDGSLTNNYNNNQFCSWLIQPPSGTVTLSFSAFATEASSDRVLVFDGIDNTAPQIGNFSGSAVPANLTSTSNSLYMEFRTNGTVTDAGWDASYINNTPATTCMGQTVITTNTGTFNDGSSATANYSDNANCSWLIQPTTPGVLINLTFSRFTTESTNDIVTVYDGATTSDPILATLSGSSSTIPSILSSGNDLLVTFVTNGSTTDLGWEANYTTQSVAPCSATPTIFTSATGTFNDGSATTANYQNNQSCEWLIQPTGAIIVQLNFNRFRTELCCDDVTIHDGTNASAPILANYRGTNIPASITTTGGALFVVFNTDGSVTDTGWEATYTSSTSQCFPTVSFTTPTGTIEDGSNLNNYQDNLACTWTIEPASATSVTANFTSFGVDNTGDTLYLYDGTSSADPLIGKFTGNSIPAAQTAASGTMFIEFITDAANNNTGWNFNYTSVIPLSCSGLTTLTAATATFDDGSAATANYDNNLSCEWLIQPTATPATITLNMNRINLAGGFFSGDQVQVYDNATGTGFPIAQYSGTFLGTPAVSNTGVMFVRFITDGNNTNTGWEATYNTSASFCQPNTTFTNNSGNITDGSPFGQNYLDNTDCSWLIQPATPNIAIRLNFFIFDTEVTNDTVTVYDGATTAAPILGTFSGNTIPPGLASSGGDMLVTFKSNGSATADGWVATYSTQNAPACAGSTTLTTANATFDDGSAPFANYIDNSNCSWLIAPTGALNIDLTFNRFATQANSDVVNVYDGNSNAAPLLGSFSGTTIPPVINSTGGSLFVEFITDGLLTTTGWEASYTSFNTVILDVPQDTVFINAGAGSTTSLNLTANVAWSNIDNAAWLVASPVNGSGNATINLLAVQANIGPERSAELIFNSAITTDADTVIVIQRTSGRFIDASPDTLFFAANAAPNQSATINSNVTWNLTPDQSWIMPTPASGTNNGNSSIMVQNNTSSSIRTSFIVVSGNLGAANDTIWVVQDTVATSSPTLSVNPMNVTLAQAMGSTDLFTVNSNTTWQTTSGATWLTVTNPTTTAGTQMVQVTANSINLAPLPRATFVAVQDVAGTLFDTVFVFQAGTAPILIGAPDTILLGNTINSTGVLNVGSTGTWTGIEGDTWFSLSQTTGSGITMVNLTTNSTNTNATQRISYVALADAVNSLTDTIVVIQDTSSIGLAANPDTLKVGAAVGSSATFTVSSSLSWIATPSATWLTVTPANGTGSGSVSVTADANPTSANRMAFVEVSSTGGAINKDTVWVIQNSFIATLEANPSVVNIGFLNGSNGIVDITSNTSWVITNPASWLSVSSTSGVNDQTLTITATSDNLTGATRTATILVDGISAVTQTITVNQIDGSSPIFVSSKDTVFVDNIQGSTGIFSILSNANSWTVSENTSWLLINPTSGSQTQTITSLVATRNIFGTTRYANITGSSTGFTDLTVVVAQKESTPIFQVAPDSILVGADSLDFTEFNISSNMPIWNISENASWVRISPENGAFTQRVTAMALESNTTGAQRSVIATITAPPLVPQTIRIVQDTIRTTGIESHSIATGLSVYPNPTNGQVTVELAKSVNTETVQIQLFNLIGEQIPIQAQFNAENKIFLNLENQASGIYFISIQSNGEMVNRKLILTE